MSLRAVNLNLLPVLRTLLHERNVSRAAVAAGMSQPAASRALAQLRGVLNDPLLIPSGRGFELTARGEALLEPVDRLCRELEAVWQSERFYPGAIEREFVIASSDYAAILIVPRLAPRLLTEAPGVTLRFTQLVPHERLSAQRSADFALIPEMVLDGLEVGDGFFTPLFHDEFVPVVAATHPLAHRSVSPEEIDSYPHVAFGSSEKRTGLGDGVEALSGRRPKRLLAVVQHFGALPVLALATGSVAIMPRRLAEAMQAQMPIVVIEEAEPRARVNLCLAWSPRFEVDAAHRWFRELLVEVMTDGRMHPRAA